VRKAEGIYLVGTLHNSCITSVGRGVGVVGNHIMNDAIEIVAAIATIIREQRVDFFSVRAGLDRRTFKTIERACVDIKTIRAVGVVESDDDEIFFLLCR
jgi:hypothetical protein